MWVLFQRQRQEVLLPSLETCNNIRKSSVQHHSPGNLQYPIPGNQVAGNSGRPSAMGRPQGTMPPWALGDRWAFFYHFLTFNRLESYYIMSVTGARCPSKQREVSHRIWLATSWRLLRVPNLNWALKLDKLAGERSFPDLIHSLAGTMWVGKVNRKRHTDTQLPTAPVTSLKGMCISINVKLGNNEYVYECSWI